MISGDGKIKSTLYLLHCTCLCILTFKYEYVFLFTFLFFVVSFSIHLFPRDCARCFTNISVDPQKNPEDEYFRNWIWGGTIWAGDWVWKRDFALVWWWFTGDFRNNSLSPNSLPFYYALFSGSCLLIGGWVREFWKIWLMCSFGKYLSA